LSGMISWLAALTVHIREILQIAGLALPMVGFFALGFIWLVHIANKAGAQQAKVSTGALQAVLGFALGALAGIIVAGQAYPGSLIGLCAGLLLGWVQRRAAA